MRANKKYDYNRNIRHYNFGEEGSEANPTPGGDLIERAAYAIYSECRIAEYAYADMAKGGSVMVSNFKEGYEVHLTPVSNGGVKIVAKINQFYGKAQVQRTFKTEYEATADAIRYLVWLAAQKFTTKDNDSVTHINRRDGIPSSISHGGKLIPVTTAQQNAIEAIWNTFPDVNDLFIKSDYYPSNSAHIVGHKISCTTRNENLVRVYVNFYGQDRYTVEASDASVDGIESAFKDAMDTAYRMHDLYDN